MLWFWTAGWKDSNLTQYIGSKGLCFDCGVKKLGNKKYLNTSVSMKRVDSKNTGSVPRCIICAQGCERQAFHLVGTLALED